MEKNVIEYHINEYSIQKGIEIFIKTIAIYIDLEEAKERIYSYFLKEHIPTSINKDHFTVRIYSNDELYVNLTSIIRINMVEIYGSPEEISDHMQVMLSSLN